MSDPAKPRGLIWLVSAFLALAIVLIYGQTIQHEFINYDTHAYLKNEFVTGGLSWESIGWAMTTFELANWHPLTWLSHLVDLELFGLEPGWHHGVNVLWHIINSCLLFIVLLRLTSSWWPAAMVAALFAVHPTHVQSVAWVAERKDLLSAFFFLLCIWSYAHFTVSRHRGVYLLLILLFAFGLMSKPMLVTLPFVLLLLDVWPLNRINLNERNFSQWLAPLRLMLVEKIPLFLMTAGSCVVTYLAQQTGGAMKPGQGLELSDRLVNAVVAYGFYIEKTLMPQDLALFYIHPVNWPVSTIAISLTLLFVISVTVLTLCRKHPYLLVGWCWYLGMLVPVIGLVQVGAQAAADRYTYLPAIGLYIMMMYSVWSLAQRYQVTITKLTLPAVVVLLTLTLNAWQNTRHWQNSITIWQQTLSIIDEQYTNYVGLTEGEFDGPRSPSLVEPYVLAGLAFEEKEYKELALRHYDMASAIDPTDVENLQRRGKVLVAMGRKEDALMVAEEIAALLQDDDAYRRKVNQLKQVLP